MVAIARQVLLWAVLLCLGGYLAYIYTTPCRPPVEYSLGTIDAGFGISSEELLSAIEEAEALWERAAGKNLFIHQDSGGMPINLVYDTRQQVTQQNNAIKESIDTATESAEALKSAYDAARERYAAARAEYEAAAASAQTPRQYQEAERKRRALNAEVDTLNALGSRYNALVGEINEDIARVNQTSGREFEEGLYSANLFGAAIDIYEYSSRAALVRVLSHEMGHSLGLSHVAGKDSIMHELNTSDALEISVEDRAELARVCGI